MSVGELTNPHLSESEATRREAKRQEMMAKVPDRYSGRAHWAFINLMTILGIGLCLVALESPDWWEWLFFLSVLAYYFVYEWFHFAHHLRRDSWLGRRAVVGWLRTHHTRHHELALMEKGNFNVSFPLWDRLLGTMLPDVGRESRSELA